MRITVFMRNVLLFLAIAAPVLLHAQFQQPTDEELKMTSDPKAPGAAAVYLNIEETANDPSHYQSFYARIKVLTEKGKELATVEIPYLRGDFKISDIQARTIHADGTVIPLKGKPEDLLISKTTAKDGDKLQVNKRVFTLPSVEVGSILEYRYILDYDNDHFSTPFWEIQRPYFVHKAHYFFIPFPTTQPGVASSMDLEDEKGRGLNTLMCWQILPPGVQVKNDVTGHFSLDIKDVPPSPDEEWMPPIHSILYKVLFYYTYAHSAAEFWNSEAKIWSKNVNHFAESSKSIQEAVSSLIAPGDGDLDKAKKLYKAVQALDNTDFSRQKTESEHKELKQKVQKRAEDTWAQKSGSSDDIALLYLAMLRAAGLNASAMKVVDREQGVFDPAYMSFDQLDDTLVVLNIGGKEMTIDPSEKMCPFGTVSWRHSDASGARQGPDNHNAGTTPVQQYPDNKTLRIGDATVDGQGNVTADFRVVMTGQEALHWRQVALRNDQDEVKKQFDHWLESMVPDGIEAHISNFTGIDDPDVNLIAFVKAHGTIGAATSKRLLLPGFFFEIRSAHPFVAQDKRQAPVDMHFGDLEIDQITYHLPPGFSVEGAPQDAKITWSEHAIFLNKIVPSPGQITIARSLARAFTLAKPEEYQDLRGFYQKIAAADQQELVLTATQAGKGN